MTIAINILGNNVWICLLSPTTQLIFLFIMKGLKAPRGIIWITSWAPWMVHAQGIVMMRILWVPMEMFVLCCTMSNHGLSMCDKCELMYYCTTCIDTGWSE